MSVFRRGRLRVVRWAIGVGVLAASPFAMAGVAQATAGRANPSNFTSVPNFRFVNINQTLDQAGFCFDNNLSNNGVGGATLNNLAGNFALIGYRWNIAALGRAASLNSSDQRCVNVTISLRGSQISGATRNLSSYSLGSVKGGTVILNAGGASPLGNVGDSAPNIGSNQFNSHAGTAGHAAGPQVQGLVGGAAGIDTTDNALFVQFDQELAHQTAELAASCGRIFGYDTTGIPHYGVVIGTNSSGQAEVLFGTPAVNAGCAAADAGFNVTQIKRLTVSRSNAPGNEGFPVNQTGAVTDNGGDLGNPPPGAPTGNPNLTFSIPIPGTGGVTNRADLVSATINANSNTADAVFTVPVSVSSQTSAADAVLDLSDSNEEQATSEQVIGSAPVTVNGVTTNPGNNVVRFTFNGLGSPENSQHFSEHAVGLSVYGRSNGTGTLGSPCAVRDLNNPSQCNTTGGVPVGDNAGAFITGYSSGPDPTYLIIDKTAGLVRIGTDDRVDPATVTPGNVVAVDSTGTAFTTLASATVTVTDNGFLSEVDLNVNPSTIRNTADIQIVGAPWGTSTGNTAPGGQLAFGSYHGASFPTNWNVESVFSPSAIAAQFRSIHKANRAALKRAIKRSLRKHRAHRHHRR